MKNNRPSIRSSRNTVVAWLRIFRLQFFPMCWVSYSAGAACAAVTQGVFYGGAYLAGYLCLFLLELCTILLNEYFDYGTDRLNYNSSLYTGGSRVLVEGLLSFRHVRVSVAVVLLIFIAAAFLLVLSVGQSAAPSVVGMLLLGLLFGIGYTTPPLKFCYRGLGELVVGLTNGPYVLLAGFLFQLGNLRSPMPWLLSLPLFFAVFAAITISGLPDYSADRSVSKKTLSVLLGPHSAAILALVSVLFAILSACVLFTQKFLHQMAIVLLAVTVPHSAFLCVSLLTVIRKRYFDNRIDGVMRLALLYIVWFGLIPLLSILWQFSVRSK